VQGAGFRGYGSGLRMQGAGCRVYDAGYRVQGAGCRVQGVWCRGWYLDARLGVTFAAAASHASTLCGWCWVLTIWISFFSFWVLGFGLLFLAFSF